MLQTWFEAVSSGWPGRCQVCGAWPAQPVCAACVQQFARATPRCDGCALSVPPGVTRCGQCLLDPPALDTCHAAVDYAYPWAGLITRFKFRPEPGWAPTLAALMRRPGIDAALAACDLVVPLPLSRQRMAERGFNQAAELARRLSARKLTTRLLLRVRDTPPQASLDKAQRHQNVAHAFAVDPGASHRLRERSVLLLDDVMTSGASLEAAAGALRRAGAQRVVGVVLARTPAP